MQVPERRNDAMTMTVWRVLRALTGVERGRSCRNCGEAILAKDPFGMSEGVCNACRTELA
jgi:hypothetical protein